MAIGETLFLVCDGLQGFFIPKDCAGTFRLQTPNRDLLKRLARKAGWDIGDAKHYCPMCATRLAQATVESERDGEPQVCGAVRPNRIGKGPWNHGPCQLEAGHDGPHFTEHRDLIDGVEWTT
jgi:hypothetical protein